jgi:hypothetical protein
MKRATIALAMGLAVSGCASQSGVSRVSATPSGRVVQCSDIIGTTESEHADGYRVILGTIGVPPAFLGSGLDVGVIVRDDQPDADLVVMLP